MPIPLTFVWIGEPSVPNTVAAVEDSARGGVDGEGAVETRGKAI